VIRAVTALTDSRGKLIKIQIEEKLRSGLAALQGSGRKWDREFESGLLQRRVSCEPDFLDEALSGDLLDHMTIPVLMSH
jgi:hypothetical protein